MGPTESLPFGLWENRFLAAATPNKYTGKPLDATGLSYFGARYYDGSTQSPTLRWISPDPITTHIYDPLSLNKYSYVRNDPVNLIDPDGRNEAAPNGNGPWFLWWGWDIPSPVYTVNNDGYPVLVPLASSSGHEPGDDIGHPDMPGTEPRGGSGATFQSLADLLANTTQLKAGLRDRAGTDAKKGACYEFLLKVITQLSSGRSPVLAANLTVEGLVNNIMAAAKTATTVAALHANAQTSGNAISIAQDPVDSMGNDYFSTLLHEGFHLLMSGRRGQISDDQLMPATSKADGTRFQGGSTSEFNKQMFGANCGPGM
jgi:RHS repeat-associated protein